MTNLPTQPSPEPKPTTPGNEARRRRLIVAASLGAVVGIALAGAVYGIAAFQRNAGDPACVPAVDVARRIAPLARGEVAGVVVAERPLRLPDLTMRDAAGQERKLSDWRGRTVLLNLWATWCVPCRKEMPALDALEAKLGGPAFQVVAINIDTRDLDKPKTWLKDTGIDRLPYYADPSAKVFQELKAIGKAFGMPTTLLVDPAGCELGVLAGPAEWASDDAIKLVEAALRR
jgi:thiol-disulfide isomerase/thioredoxin